MRMEHEQALKELLKVSKIENKIKIIKNITDNGLLSIG